MIQAVRRRFNHLDFNIQLLIVLTLLNVLDFQTTKIIVDKVGFDAEANVFLYWAMVATGTVWAIFWVKAVVLGVVFWAYRYVEEHHTISPKRFGYVIAAMCVGFACVVCWNVFVMWHAGALTTLLS